jgi:2'-5' RNA ligase
MNYQKINIAFRVSKDIESEVINLSQEIGKSNDSYFVLNGINFYPHITIYSSIFSESNLSDILEIVDNFAQKLNSINLEFDRVESGQGYISLNFISSDKIKKIHEEFVKALNPLRRALTENDLSDYHIVFNEKQKKNIINYGYPDAMDLYSPHMTIIRLKDEKIADERAKEIKWNIKDLKIDNIACFLMGENGTCNQIIKEFNF